ncbi:MAG TPA: hypothetical protein VGP47_01240 [Parachlamydiaceae bacterium]|nr:hypothetical protein [Parachlamydiaceae bacterium]
MHFLKIKFLLPILLLPAFILFGDHPDDVISCEEENISSLCETTGSVHFHKANTISFGPEVYRVTRDRSGGAKQKGNSAGIRVNYDRIKRYHFYLGAQLFYGTGILRGHTSIGDKIRSRLTEKMIEGNAGYTFQAKCFPHISFTPFVGYGYFRDVNKFSPPTNLQITFTTQFRYLSFGFLSNFYVLPCITIGLNGRFKWPWETRCKVTNDPDFDTIRQIVKDKLQYRIEVPITYFGCFLRDNFELSFTPFYERRLYGARENFPFDFYRTEFTLYGANVQMIYRF